MRQVLCQWPRLLGMQVFCRFLCCIHRRMPCEYDTIDRWRSTLREHSNNRSWLCADLELEAPSMGAWEREEINSKKGINAIKASTTTFLQSKSTIFIQKMFFLGWKIVRWLRHCDDFPEPSYKYRCLVEWIWLGVLVDFWLKIIFKWCSKVTRRFLRGIDGNLKRKIDK